MVGVTTAKGVKTFWEREKKLKQGGFVVNCLMVMNEPSINMCTYKVHGMGRTRAEGERGRADKAVDVGGYCKLVNRVRPYLPLQLGHDVTKRCIV